MAYEQTISETAIQAPGSVVSVQETFGMSPTGWAEFLRSEIAAAERDKRVVRWRDRGNRCVARYRDERAYDAIQNDTRKYNIFWSNVQTLLPALFGAQPEPLVERRYNDPDNVARVAALILERVLKYQMDAQQGWVPGVRNALQDRLIPGLGVLWVRYEEHDDTPVADPNAPANEKVGNVTNSYAEPPPTPSPDKFRTMVDYVYWQDFGFVPSRVWDEVPMVWRKVYMTRDELVQRFGKKVGNDVPLNYVPLHHTKDGAAPTDVPTSGIFKQAEVYEVWDKRRRVVTWINKDVETPLDVRHDPLELPGFFPCPRPLFATNTTGNLTPVPDYILYQDQAQELDTVTQRLHMLTKACKVVGVYDSEQLPVQRMLTEGIENQLIPVDTWAAFAEKGGLKGVVDFLPLDKVIEVIVQLSQIKQAMIADIYQITGISDIVRGASSDRATATEQRIKAQYASIRLDDMKSQVAQFVTDTLRIMGHLAVKFFPAEILVAQSNIMQSMDGVNMLKEATPPAPPQPPMPAPGAPPGLPPPPGGMAGPGPGGPPVGPAPMPPQQDPQQMVILQAVQLLKSQTVAFRIDIVAESLIVPELEDQRQQAGEFMTSMTQFLQQALPAVQSNPQMAPLMQALMMWSIRRFRVGRDIEGMIDAAMTKIATTPPPPPPPDPKVEALKVKAQMDQQKMAADIQADRERMAMEQQKMAAELQADREKNASRHPGHDGEGRGQNPDHARGSAGRNPDQAGVRADGRRHQDAEYATRGLQQPSRTRAVDGDAAESAHPRPGAEGRGCGEGRRRQGRGLIWRGGDSATTGSWTRWSKSPLRRISSRRCPCMGRLSRSSPRGTGRSSGPGRTSGTTWGSTTSSTSTRPRHSRQRATVMRQAGSGSRCGKCCGNKSTRRFRWAASPVGNTTREETR